MKLRIFHVFFITITLNNITFSQYGPPCIPESRLVDWGNAGLLSETPNTADNVINISSYYGSDYNKIVAAINDANSLPGMTIIYFPPGTYTIGNTINISSVKDSGIIFQGAGSDETLLQFSSLDKEDHCFNIKGQYIGSQKAITQDITKGSTTIYFYMTGEINSGDWIHFSEPDFDDNYGSSSEYIGQITKVNSLFSDYVIIKDEASKFYSSENNMRVREIDPIKNIGFENFKIERTNTAKGYGVTFRFEKSVNCWIRGVESYKCTGYHVNASISSHLEISGCYFHHATNYDSYEGTGYGLVLGNSTTNCLIENNIFKTLRHAMLVGNGANCNVFAYNYSRDPKWDWDWLYGASDICLHGKYPYSNLFEHNKVEKIWADPTHGINGPYNTMLRNDVYNGKIFLCNSDYTNAVGCNTPYVDTNPQLAEWIWEIWS